MFEMEPSWGRLGPHWAAHALLCLCSRSHKFAWGRIERRRLKANNNHTSKTPEKVTIVKLDHKPQVLSHFSYKHKLLDVVHAGTEEDDDDLSVDVEEATMSDQQFIDISIRGHLYVILAIL